ncbi:MAG: UDP-N-acetylmuramate dehydrogenase [Lachnospiraceae bacterium]|nr:UDP-N-acetylmuramate dehydrogenase [Lachnospiraceae bacterium]MBR6851897.1 UDP-N-acetylmuramate dehydrogenase [Lachnospiraceae bacterium]
MEEQLKIYSDDVRRDEPMRKHTTFRVGGPADFFVSVKDREALVGVTTFLKENGIPYFLLGNGSNLLVSDAGYRGVILQLTGDLAEIAFDGECVRAGAGVQLMRLAAQAAERGLSGLEFASGIPGTVGGAIVMNAGAYGGEMVQVVESADIFFLGEGIVTVANPDLHFGYRHSVLKEKEGVVLSVALRLQFGEKETIIDKIADLKEQRREKQPLEYASAGSTFKRPEGAFAGKLISDAGLKGCAIGDACVSEKHAGFIVNKGNASADEIYRLIREVRDKVQQTSGYLLEPEVIMLGEFYTQ